MPASCRYSTLEARLHVVELVAGGEARRATTQIASERVAHRARFELEAIRPAFIRGEVYAEGVRQTRPAPRALRASVMQAHLIAELRPTADDGVGGPTWIRRILAFGLDGVPKIQVLVLSSSAIVAGELATKAAVSAGSLAAEPEALAQLALESHTATIVLSAIARAVHRSSTIRIGLPTRRAAQRPRPRDPPRGSRLRCRADRRGGATSSPFSALATGGALAAARAVEGKWNRLVVADKGLKSMRRTASVRSPLQDSSVLAFGTSFWRSSCRAPTLTA